MKSLFRLIVLVLFLAGWALAALSLHVVRTPEKIGIVTKSGLGWRDTYVDTRHWTLEDAANHPVLLDRLIKAGKTDLLAHVTRPQDGRDLQTALNDALAAGPTAAPADPVQDLKDHAKAVAQTAASKIDVYRGKH